MNRIAELRKKAGLSQKELSKIICVAQNTLCNWENEKREPDNKAITQMANYFNVTIDYLLGRTDNNGTATQGVKIPVYGRVAAGIPIDAIEDILDYEEITEDEARKGDFFALKIKGHSMEPTISHNDVVIVRRQPDVENGEIAIVLVNGEEATCKKIKKTPEGVLLIPINPNYDTMFYSNKDIEQLPVTVLGKVVEARRKFEII